jgi:hypothetical protein
MNRDRVHVRTNRTSRARRAALLIAIATTGLFFSACGASHSPNSVSTTTAPSTGGNGGGSNAGAFAFAQCMQTGGVPNFPEPNSSGVFAKETPEQLGVSVSKYRSTQRGCAHLLPNGNNGPTAAQQQYVKELGLEFAHCMRSHGVNLPDPGSDGRIPDPASVGINQGSPLFQAGNNTCARFRPPYMPSNAQYNAYVRSNG